MGKRARNRRRAQRAQPWEGIDGRNPLTLVPEALEPLVPRAREHIAAVGFSDDGRPSLAGCWVLGEQLLAAAVDAGTAPGWEGQAHPLVVAYLGATGDPQALSLPLEAVGVSASGALNGKMPGASNASDSMGAARVPRTARRRCSRRC